MTEILIVEDERICAERYADLFEQAGYAVRVARSAETAWTAFEHRMPDVVLLDVMLPKGDGFTLCRRLRERDALVPIVFNTALDGTEDKMRGLELGGDDYVLKADPPEELLARVARAVSRYAAFSRACEEAGGFIVIGPCTVNLSKLTLTDELRRPISLTRTEADILRLLDSKRDKTFTIDEIITATRGEGFVCDDNAVYVHLSNLRRKLGRARTLLVHTRGEGYRLLS